MDEFRQEIEDRIAIKKQQKEFQIRKMKRLNIFMHVVLCFVCQIVLIALILKQLIIDDAIKFRTIEESSLVLFARFICASILHLSLIDEVYAGLDMMKYCLNHEYRFASMSTAFIVGLLQASIVFSVEFVNIIIILTSFKPTNIVFNFIALAIIAEFDNFVYESLRNESMKKLLDNTVNDKILVIAHTTSKRCRDDELSTIPDENGDLRPLKVTYKSRRCCNKFAYCLYKVYRILYVSLYFYFFPFSVIILSQLLPLLLTPIYPVH